ncbi:MAG TPA: hypothetical protein VL403_09615 [Candidatus Kryptonia bacterium]|nr:hypothetical protein [Candidatus Kryptonia bacterium]
MRWVYRLTVAALSASLIAACGSGGDAGDRLTMQFLGFQSPGATQLDAVNQTSAEVDVFQDVCTDLTIEPFQETNASALFMNNGASDINVDTIVVNIPNSGVPEFTRTISQILPGGRCSSPSGLICSFDSDCTSGLGQGTCSHIQSTLTFLLFDIDTKLRVSPGTYDVSITFSGEDASNERFDVTTHMTVTFQDFCHCSAGCA